MSRRLVAGLVAAGVLALAIPLVLLSRPGDEDAIRDRMAGDVEETVAGMDAEEMPARAEAFLATDRPWRASRTMATYLDRAADPPPEHLLLAARAEAGWGDWLAVLGLLDDLPALDTYENGLGVYLLARARDEGGDAAGAVEAYRAFLTLSPPAGELEEERSAARLRLGLALIRVGEAEEGRSELRAAAEAAEIGGTAASFGGESPWIDILRADAHASAGDTTAVRHAVAGLDSGLPGLRAWRARIEAARRAGDMAGARSLANQARSWAGTSTTRSEFLLEAGRAALAMGDTAAAREAFRSVIDRGAAGAHARNAASLLREAPPQSMSPEDHLAVARVYSAQGLHEESIDGYRQWIDADMGSASERADVHMEHANALFYAGRYDEVGPALRPVASRTAARLLRARAEAHRDNTDEAVETYLSVARAFAGSGTGSNALFLAAGALHDEGAMDRARELYREVVRRYPGSDRMGLATMRLAGMAFQEGEYAEAMRLWDGYRNRYPRGDRALQATYWAGRARQEMGDSAAAADLFRQVRARERDSYYALEAGERLGEPFWPLPMSSSPASSPAADRRVAEWMREIDLLRNAGFPEAASARVDAVVDAVGGDRQMRYALAEALVERGYSQRAIRIGITLQGSGPPSRRLLRILYPFPYRTLITEEARDRELDPFVAAALIRQESMFEARITSHVGARGLMQIMPATGRGLAAAIGMDRWDPEVLYHPEINVHMGTRYLAQHMENYAGSLPSVFSAYNAGAHRVEWWSEFPEYGSDELFTERIPYRETRDYVKILTRNRALYSGLYTAAPGTDAPEAADRDD